MKIVTYIFMIFLGFSSQTFAGDELFYCSTPENEKKINITGYFHMTEKKSISSGNVTFSFPGEFSQHFYHKVQFIRGAWTVDRMNFHLRGEDGSMIAGLIIDDYFSAKVGEKINGSLYGKYGDRAMACEREVAQFYTSPEQPIKPPADNCDQCYKKPTWDCLSHCPEEVQ
ncbi:MAG: hypothetical protein HYS98_04980 [Deltaproteobacteria bacterium]|nr:hypothetical protein [Deltaproteobacteria bacterium]